MVRRKDGLICGLILALAAAAFGQTGADRCAALAKLQVPGVALEIAKAEWHAAGTVPGQPGQAFPGRSRPLCPYPQHTYYKGTGDVNDSSSFECR